MNRLVLKDLVQQQPLSELESRQVRGGLVRIFENDVLDVLRKGGVEAAGEIQESRSRNDIFSYGAHGF